MSHDGVTTSEVPHQRMTVLAVISSRRAAVCASVLVIATFLIIGLVRVHPYTDDVNAQNSAGDDWWAYKRFAISILDDGLEIPAVDGAYYTPGGFLYNYFIAAIFGLMGRRTGFVYVIQYVCLGGGALLMYFLARRYMSAAIAFAYLLASAVFYFDSFRDWVTRLLSENLVIVLYPMALIFAADAISKRSTLRATLAGIFCGLVVLTRPNMIAFPIAIAACVFVYGQRRRRGVRAAVVLAAAGAVVSLLVIRNAYVTGEFILSPSYSSLLPEGSVRDLLAVLWRRMLFCAGVMLGGWDLKGQEVIVHSRWLLISLSAIVAAIILAWRRRFTAPDALCVATMIAALVPFVALPALGGYGFRFQMPYGPVLMFLVFHAAQVLVGRWFDPSPVSGEDRVPGVPDSPSVSRSLQRK